MVTGTKRPKDEPRVTSPTAGDALLLDGATTRSIAYENLIRAPLAGITQYYVNPATGSDTLMDGLTALSPFATRQKALDTVRNSLDQRGYSAPINLANGTYTDPVSIIGGGPYVMIGNTGAPANVVDAVVGSSNITVKNAYLTVSGMEMRNLVGGLAELLALEGGDITWSAMRFGTTDGDQMQAKGGKIHGSGAYSIVGNLGSHGHARYRGLIDIDSAVCTLVGTPAIGNYFFGINDASIHFTNSSFAGTGATGQRFVIHNTGSFDSNGAFTLTSLPGTVAGLLDSSGRYDSYFIGDSTQWTAYVPSVASHTVGGTPATYVVNSARYKMLTGKTCLVSVSVGVSNQGVGAGGTIDIDLPFAAKSNCPADGNSFDFGSTGMSGGAFVGSAATFMRCARGDSLTYIVTGAGIVATVEYEIA